MHRRSQNRPGRGSRSRGGAGTGSPGGGGRGHKKSLAHGGHARSTRSILEELFVHPPVSRAELEQRLAPASVLEARRAMVERLSRGDIEEADGDLLISIFHIIGIGRESQALFDLVADVRRDRHVRAYALTVLLHADPQYSDKLREVVCEEDLLSLAAQPMCQFLCHVEGHPEEGEQLALTLESAPADLRLPLFEHLDEFRQKSGVPAAVAYEEVLRRKALSALRQPILDALTQEGGHDAIELIETLRGESSDPGEQRAFQGLLLRLRTRELEGRTRPLGKTRAYISSCDGQSAFFVLGERENPDGTHTLALLCIRAAGDVRDGYVATRQPESQTQQLLARFTTDAGTEFVKVPLEQAAPLVQLAVDRTLAEGRQLPDSARPALRFFDRASAQALPTPEKRARPTLAALRKLLSRPPYARAWFIDPSDLEACRIAPPKSETPTLHWMKLAVKRLAAHPPLLHRVSAMAHHMAVWHTLRGEPREAELLLAAGEVAERTPEKSSLLRVLLERLFVRPDAEELHASEHQDGEPLGEPTRRQYLKSRFFLELAEPKGRDLALLDLTEAALLGLERALDTVPGEARPREDAVQDAAYEIAELFRDYVVLTRHSPPSLLSERMAAILASVSDLPPDECHRLALMLLAALVSFVDEVCGDCKVRCLNNPRAAVAAEFFSPMHPALSLPIAPERHP